MLTHGGAKGLVCRNLVVDGRQRWSLYSAIAHEARNLENYAQVLLVFLVVPPASERGG